jgi:AraC family transcriptional activator of pobA
MDLPSAGMIRGDISALQRTLDSLIAEADRPGIGHDRAMQAHMALLNVAMHRARNLAVVKNGASLRARNHAQAFSELVDRRFRETRRIADYASALGVSQTHLNRISREILGASALEVVERRIALEARRQLLFSTLTIKQIGAGLGYDDPGYFTRFLKRILGVAPKTFRQQRDRPDR